MEHNDYFFYLVIALSVIGSLMKAFKKKPDETQLEPKRSVGGELLKKLLEEMGEKDDYIPRNPTPAPVAKPATLQPVTRPSDKTGQATFVRSGNVEKGYVAPEAKERNSTVTSESKGQLFEPIVDSVDPFMASLDFSSSEEMKKAIIYSTILTTKF